MAINEEIAKAFGAHGLWKTRLQQAVDSGNCEYDPKEVCRDDRCAFGKWLHGGALPRTVTASQDYREVVDLHADFHRAAGATLELALGGRRQEAQQELSAGGFARAAQRLAAAMVRWQRNAATECSGYVSGTWRAWCFFWKGSVALRVWMAVAIPSLVVVLLAGHFDLHQLDLMDKTDRLSQLAAQAAAAHPEDAALAELNGAVADMARYDDSTLMLFNALVVLVSLLGAGVVTVLTRGLTNAIVHLSRAMRALAGGESTGAIPAIERPDEIGEMARAVLVFQQQAQMVEAMTAEREQQREKHDGERRRALIGMADDIEGKTSSVVAHVAAETMRLLDTAEIMAGGAKRVEENSQFVSSAAEQSLSNAQAVAGAAEELSASIREIASQVARSTEMVDQAVAASDQASQTVDRLTEAMAAIDQVVGVITNIAGQTNLLALNATIEAARAGEAGKGFAVVANEVKNLANQTGREAHDISRRISELNEMATEVRSAIAGTVESIRNVETIADAVAAAVEEQDAATNEIARNIQQAAAAAQEVSSHIGSVAAEASSTGEQAVIMERMVDAMAEKVTELGHVLTQVVRTTAPEVDRRHGQRVPVRKTATISLRGGSYEGELRDVSSHGAAMAGVPKGEPGDNGTLTVDGITTPFTIVARDRDVVRLRVQRDGVFNAYLGTPSAQAMAA